MQSYNVGCCYCTCAGVAAVLPSLCTKLTVTPAFLVKVISPSNSTMYVPIVVQSASSIATNVGPLVPFSVILIAFTDHH